jgi:PmbA protein
MSDKLFVRGHLALEAAASLGADECQVEVVTRQERKLSVESSEWQALVDSESLDISITVHKDGRRAKVKATGEADPGTLVVMAMEAARFNPVDDHLCMADPGPCVELTGQFDPELAGLDGGGLARLVELALEAGKHELVVGTHLSVTQRRTSDLILNSRGVARQRTGTLLDYNMYASGRNGDRVTGECELQGSTRRLSTAREMMSADMKEMTRRILGSFDPVKGPSGRQALVLSPALVNQLLVGVLIYNAHGDRIADGVSRLADSLGSPVAGPLFSLEDAVHDTSLSGATAFDEEGSATHPLALVTEGVLTAHLDSCRSAHRRGTRTTGHTWSLHAPVVTGGDLTPEALGALAGEFLLAVDFSGDVDYQSGDFSGVLKGSRWCNPTKGIDVPLIETMISGNVFELLHRIVAVGRQENLSGYARMPWILVEEVEVSTG